MIVLLDSIDISIVSACDTHAHMCSGRSLLDPTHSEEELAVGNISFCFHDNSLIQLSHTGIKFYNIVHNYHHLHVSTTIGEGISSDVILSLSKVAQNQAKYLSKLLNEAMHSTHK